MIDHALHFKKRGYQVVFACNNTSPLHQKCIEYGIETWNIYANNRSFLNAYKIASLSKALRNKKIDTVIFTTSHDSKLVGIAAHWAGVKNIVYMRGLAVEVKANGLNNWLFKKAFTHIIANSNATKNTILKNLHPILPAEKIRVIYHGIETNHSTHKTLDAIANHARGIVLGNAGRLTLQKGQHYLIDVARILKNNNIDFTLFIAGTGELEADLKQLIAAHNLQSYVFLLGFVEDVTAFMQSIDIFLLGSSWEGFGFVLAEAMANHKPVVAFNCSSNPELVAHNETGLLATYPDTNSFAQCVMELANDAQKRTILGENGYKKVVREFNITKQIDAVIAHIEST